MTAASMQGKRAVPNKSFLQAAWIVDDLDAAMQRWLDTTSVGPFFAIRHVELTVDHRGRPSTVDMSFALGQSGGMQIELIQQHNNAGSAYRDSAPGGSPVMHHIAALVADVAEERARFRRLGIEVAHEGTFGPNGMEFIYYDTREQIGCMTELLGPDDANLRMMERVAAAGAEWDGRDPVRSLESLM